MPENDLTDLERSLASLKPVPAEFNRDLLLYRAGQASVPRLNVWRWAAIGSSAIAAGLAMILILQPPAKPVIQVVHVPHIITVPTPHPSNPFQEPTREPQADPPQETLSYWRLHQQALRWGIEGLPDTPAESGANNIEIQREVVELSAGARPKLIPGLSHFIIGE